MDELIREVERNIRNSKELLKTVENRVAYQKNDLAYCREKKTQLEFYEGVHKELEYAKRCHELEEELGCPLEVREKALIKDFIWYDDNDRLIQVIAMNSGYIMEKGKKTAVLNCIYNFNFWLAIKCKDYKKTWWLREDKSE